MGIKLAALTFQAENQHGPSQFHSCRGLWGPGLGVSDGTSSLGALLLFPFPLREGASSPMFRNSVIHRLLLGLFLLSEIKGPPVPGNIADSHKELPEVAPLPLLNSKSTSLLR